MPALRYCSETLASTPPASRASKRWRACSTMGRSSVISSGGAGVATFGWGAGVAGVVTAPRVRIASVIVRSHALMPQRYRDCGRAGVSCGRRRRRMANDRGLLPKARRDELTEPLQTMLDRWYRNAYEDDNLFLTMARRPELLEATWGFIRYIYGGRSTIEPELFELVRVKLAWNNRCV